MKLTLFCGILHMSLIASFVILIVLFCRVLLKKAPKIFSYALWGVVLFRLLCPVSIDLPVSFLPNTVTEPATLEQFTVEPSKKTTNTVSLQNWNYNSHVALMNNTQINTVSNTTTESHASSATTYETIFSVLANIWLAGIGIMLVYSTFSLIRLKRKLVGSVPYDATKKIYLSDYIETPFVIGLFRPRIYLPSHLNDTEMEYILLHEKHHIYRKDHLIKTVAYVALILHWFNPFVWISFILSGKDMEMSCDEAVMRKMGGEICEVYSSLLLRLATGKTMISPAPLAFGEGDTKDRIVNVLKWKKPAAWVVAVATVVCLFTAVGCVANEKSTGVYTVQTFEKNEYVGVYKEYITTTYHKMSDGTWTADVENANGNVTTQTYQYRHVFHGTMPNAAVASNYILLSNKKNITFKQTWLASGLSSNMNDYFDSDETIFVSTWIGDLDTQHPEQDKDTIYHIDSDDDSVKVPLLALSNSMAIPNLRDIALSKKFELAISFPENTNWIQNVEYAQNTHTYLEILYWDAMAEANCTLMAIKNSSIKLTDYEFDDSLTETWEAKTRSNELISVNLQRTADGKVAVASWNYDTYNFTILGDGSDTEIDASSIAKTALYIIKNLD